MVDELLINEADTRVPDDNEKTLLDFAKQQSKTIFEDERATIQIEISYEIFFSFL